MIGSPAANQIGYSARRPVVARQRGQHRSNATLAPFQPATTPVLRRRVLLLIARLRRFLNGRVAAVLAHQEQEAARFACQPDHRHLDRTRIYRGPIDVVLVRLRQHAS